jgi:hypothetical protein
MRGLPLGVWNLPPGVRMRDTEGRSMRAIHLGEIDEDGEDPSQDWDVEPDQEEEEED